MASPATLTARGVLAIGQAMWPVRDHDEFRRARAAASRALDERQIR